MKADDKRKQADMIIELTKEMIVHRHKKKEIKKKENKTSSLVIYKIAKLTSFYSNELQDPHKKYTHKYTHKSY